MSADVRTLTFLMTDIEGSTLLARDAGDLWPSILETHHRVLREIWHRFDGRELGTEGDSHFVSFERASNALHAAIEAQRAMQMTEWPGGRTIRIRAGIHTGEALVKEGILSGLPLHEAARISSVAHGGQILMSASTHQIVARSMPDGVGMTDLGEHRLKDLDEPRRIYQVEAEGLPTRFPSLRSASGRHNLPIPATSFIGRSEEMLQIQQLMSTHRLVTLTGTGGAGKTRLALELGHRSLGGFRDGIWFIDLSPIDDSTIVPQVTLSAMGLKEDPGRLPIDALANALRSMSALLIFDNCERLVDGCAEVSKRVLAGCPEVCLLMTSRQPIGVSGEATWQLGPLSIPSDVAESSLEDLTARASVELFLSRASSVRPGFGIDASNARSIARICRRVDGLPLAIELAASKVDVLSIEAIAKRLDESYKLLGDTRSTSLRAVIDSSYGLLSDLERALLTRLSVFGGGWTLEAAEEVCSDETIDSDDVLDLLSALVRKSLVTFETEGRGRYRMLEPIREYAAEKLEEDEGRASTHQAFIDWLDSLVSERDARFGVGEFSGWLDEMDEERDNIRAALGRCLADEAMVPIGLRLVTKSYSWWKVRGPRAEGQRWLEEFASKIGPGVEGTWEALTDAADLASDRGEIEHARRILAQALALAESDRSELPRAGVLATLSFFESTWGNSDEAMRIGKEALSIYEELEPSKAKQMRFRLAAMALAAGDVSDRPFVEQELADAKDAHYRGACARSLGYSHLLADDLDQATRLFEAALADARSVRCVDCGASSMTALAITGAKRGELAAAWRLYREALEQHWSIEHFSGVLYSLRGLGMALASSDPERAAVLIAASDGLRARLGASQDRLWRHVELASAQADIDRRLDARAKDAAIKRAAGMSLSETIALAMDERNSMDVPRIPTGESVREDRSNG